MRHSWQNQFTELLWTHGDVFDIPTISVNSHLDIKERCVKIYAHTTNKETNKRVHIGEPLCIPFATAFNPQADVIDLIKDHVTILRHIQTLYE